MNAETEKRAISFIRTIGNRCMSCLRRSEGNCRDCISRWANSIIRDIDREKAPEIDYSLSARMLMITGALQRAARPLLASEIDLRGYCTPQLKQWTLLFMERRNIIRRQKARNGNRPTYLYSLNPNWSKNR